MTSTLRSLAALAAACVLSTACGGGGADTSVAGANVDAGNTVVGDSAAGDVATSAAASSAAAAPQALFDSNFHALCDGVGVPVGTAFSSAPGEINPVLMLAEDGDYLVRRAASVRAGWERNWTEAAPLAMAEIELVGCAMRTQTARARECTGYEIDGVESANVVHLNETSYDVTLYAATTAEVIAKKSFTFLDKDCPSFVSFDAGETERDFYSFDDGAIQDFLAPYAAP